MKNYKILVLLKAGNLLESVFATQEEADAALREGLGNITNNGGILAILGGAPQFAVSFYEVASVSDNRPFVRASSANPPMLTKQAGWRWRYAAAEIWHFQIDEPQLPPQPPFIKEPLYTVEELP